MQIHGKMIAHQRRKLSGLSNRALIDEFCAALNAFYAAGRPPKG